MSSNERVNRIARLLNKHFYNMKFDDKKKTLCLIISEEACDELLMQFLADHYNIDMADKKNIESLKRGQLFKKSDDLELSDDEEPPAPVQKAGKQPKTPEPPRVTEAVRGKPNPTPTPVRSVTPKPTPTPARSSKKVPEPEPESEDEAEYEEEEVEEEEAEEEDPEDEVEAEEEDPEEEVEEEEAEEEEAEEEPEPEPEPPKRGRKAQK